MKLLVGISILAVSMTAVSCSIGSAPDQLSSKSNPTADPGLAVSETAANADLATATFAGGCFWCMEQPFDKLAGVASTTSGYTGGTVEDPTYSQVSGGGTGHVEAMQVRYDPEQVSYDTLLETFWYNIDPLDNAGQFCDKGSQYRSAIFYEDAEQQAIAEASKADVAKELDQPIVTDILPASTFYDAEDYHQNYYKTRPIRYKAYRFGCGRDQRLSQLWGKNAPDH